MKKSYASYTYLLLILFLLLPFQGKSQEFVEDIVSIFEYDLKEADTATGYYGLRLVAAPIISYQPETSWAFGVGVKFLFKPKHAGPKVRTSNVPVSALYSLNNQIILFSSYTVFFKEEKYLLKGNLGYQRFPIYFFGLGPNSFEIDRELLNYNQYLIEPLLLRRVWRKLFIGGGFRFNQIAGVEFEEDGAISRERYPGFNGSRSFGAELALSYDSRDNVLNAQNGFLLEGTHGFYFKDFGSTQDFMLSKIDARHYWQINEEDRHVFAAQGLAQVAWQEAPLIELPSLGGDELMRGYYEGRYRDRHFFAAQVEYRRPLPYQLGFTIFAGMGDVVDDFSNHRLDQLKYSVGGGLRLLLVEEENLNLRFDYGIGFGQEFTHNYYFGIAEAF